MLHEFILLPVSNSSLGSSDPLSWKKKQLNCKLISTKGKTCKKLIERRASEKFYITEMNSEI